MVDRVKGSNASFVGGISPSSSPSSKGFTGAVETASRRQA